MRKIEERFALCMRQGFCLSPRVVWRANAFQDSFFWPLSARYAAEDGQKKGARGAGYPVPRALPTFQTASYAYPLSSATYANTYRRSDRVDNHQFHCWRVRAAPGAAVWRA